jgi:antimicrobial peptide system SdpB family protein
MASLGSRLTQAAHHHEPRSRYLAAGRSVLAIAQLFFLLATPDRILFLHQLAGPSVISCGGLKATTLWCATSPDAGRVAAIAVLLGVASGFRPRWLCIPHWYVSFSIAADVTVIDGGARVAEIVAGLLIPACLGDERTWQWVRPRTPIAPSWRGAAYAALLVLRLQMAIIYLSASLTKSAFAPWRDGDAIQALVRDPQFGVPAGIVPSVERLLTHPPLAAMLTWSIIVVEIGIAVSMAGGRRSRLAGTAAAVCLHAAIILVMGLVGFGLIMIAATAVTCTGVPAVDSPLGRRATSPCLYA